jgi:hypothetical protein
LTSDSAADAAAFAAGVLFARRIRPPVDAGGYAHAAALAADCFGLPRLGTVILIDPNGRLVQGDESTLESILAQ